MDARVLRTFAEPLVGTNGVAYMAKICCRYGTHDQWEAWVEFIPERGTPVLRSRRETTQSSLQSMEQWAERVSRVYLEGSLKRTLEMQAPQLRLVQRPEPPHFDGPSPDPRDSREPAPDVVVLNPIRYYREGESRLRDKLAALSTSELRTVVRTYGFDTLVGVDADALSREALVKLIVARATDRAE